MLRIRTFLFGTVLLCFTVLPLYGLDLIRELDWKDNGNLKVERKEEGGRMRLIFTLPKTEEPLKFINCTGLFSKVRDISDFNQLKISARTVAGQKIHLGVSFPCTGGYFQTAWSRGTTGAAIRGFQVEKTAFSNLRTPDLKESRGMILNFGLFSCDTTKGDLVLEISELELSGGNDDFLIPRPTAGVIIDGAFQKDWGYENVLYLWTPPRFLSLRGKDGKTIDGEFSFMADHENLYFLALVADATPQEGVSPKEPWNNDSIELFLASGVPGRAYAAPRRLSECGFQIVFDLSQNGKPFLFGGKGKAEEIKTALLSGDHKIGGALRKGYVLEAAIPLKFFPHGIPKKGNLLGWCVKVNDCKRGSSQLPAAPAAPERSIQNYGAAYLELRMEENFRGYAFGTPAPAFRWPERYPGGNGKIWDNAFTQKKKLTALSECIYLNGLWAVQGVQNIEQAPEPGKWFYAPLPMGMSWATPVFRPENGKLADSHYSKVTGSGSAKNPYLWYERTVEIPKNWSGKNIFFNLGHADGEVALYVNGKPAGILTSAKNRSGQLNALLKFGEKNRIDLLYSGQINPRITPNGGYGITGDLVLAADAGNEALKDIWIRKASGIDGTFRVEVRSDFARFGTLELTLLAEDGTVLYQTSRKPESENTVFSGKAERFPQWNPATPCLCSAVVRAFDRNGKLADERKVSFGFRTFEVKNGKFFLNGNPIRLRHTPVAGDASEVYDPGFFEYVKKLGFNAVYLHAGSAGNNQTLFELLDKHGFLAFCPISDKLADTDTLEELRRYRNHPANIGYISDPYGQFIFNGLGLMPFQTDDDFMPDSPKAKEIEKFLKKRQTLFAQGDPERLYIAQGTGNLPGSMRMSHHYPTGGLNLLDRMMFHAPWTARKNRKLPLSIYEAGCRSIHEMDLQHSDDKFPVSGKKDLKTWRMVNFEAAARFIGDRAFENWLEAEKLIFRASMRNYRMNGVDSVTPWGRLWYSMPAPRKGVFKEKDRRRLSWKYFTMPLAESYEDQWMKMNSWYYCLRALPDRPWPEKYGESYNSIQPTIFADIYEREMQPLFCTIAGPAGDLFSQDHNYYGGERVERSIFAVNDDLAARSFSAELRLSVDGKEYARITHQLAAEPGETLAVPVGFDLPQTTKRASAKLALFIDGQLADEFALTLFPANSAKHPEMPGLGIIGDGSFVAKTGLKAERLDKNAPVPARITRIIVERNAFKGAKTAEHLEKFLARGGQILMFEQNDSTRFGYHARERRLEHAFIAAADSAIAEGLQNEDLSFWRGRAESVANEVVPHPVYQYGIAPGASIPHLTNRNLVAGRTVELPSYGNFRPVITGGYDRAEAVVLEARSGRGRLLLCMADVTSRYGIDPAATLLADNLLREFAKTPSALLPGVRYSGDDTGKEFLSSLGIAIDPASSVGVLGKGGTLARLGDVSTVVRLPFSGTLADAVNAKSFELWCSTWPRYWNGQFSGTLELLKDLRPGTDFPASAGHVFSGLSACDFYFFELPELESLRFKEAVSDVKTTPNGFAGEGVYQGRRLIVCGVDPARIRSGEARGKALRIWSVLFSNLNIENAFRIRFSDSPLDLSRRRWTFATDPKGDGEARGFADGKCPKEKLRKIIPGIIWEAQGVTERNPELPNNPPGSAYDGCAWYFTTIRFPEAPKGKFYFHINGLRDIPTFQRTEQQSDLYINGKKLPAPVGIYNGYLGGPGARLWEFDADGMLKAGENRIALRVYNSSGAGGIDKLPVRLEQKGKNLNFLLPYEFRRSKYTNNFFWCW